MNVSEPICKNIWYLKQLKKQKNATEDEKKKRKYTAVAQQDSPFHHVLLLIHESDIYGVLCVDIASHPYEEHDTAEQLILVQHKLSDVNDKLLRCL